MPTLEESRNAFLRKIRAYTHSSERLVFETILDDFIAWSNARTKALVHTDRDYEQNVVSFVEQKTGFIVWSAYPRKDDGAKMEILPGYFDRLDRSVRLKAVAVIKTISREVISVDTTLRFPFAALRSPNSRARVKTLVDELLAALPNQT